MFARNYFAGSYFAPAYFPPNVAIVVVVPPVVRYGEGESPRVLHPSGPGRHVTVSRRAWIENDDSEIIELIPIFIMVIGEPI